MYIHVLMRDEKEGRKKRSKQGQTNNKAKQHSATKAVTFPKENELPRMGHMYNAHAYRHVHVKMTNTMYMYM